MNNPPESNPTQRAIKAAKYAAREAADLQCNEIIWETRVAQIIFAAIVEHVLAGDKTTPTEFPAAPDSNPPKRALYAVHEICNLTRCWVESSEEDRAARIIEKYYPQPDVHAIEEVLIEHGYMRGSVTAANLAKKILNAIAP